jgi:hypothetical protein
MPNKVTNTLYYQQGVPPDELCVCSCGAIENDPYNHYITIDSKRIYSKHRIATKHKNAKRCNGEIVTVEQILKFWEDGIDKFSDQVIINELKRKKRNIKKILYTKLIHKFDNDFK